MNLVRIIGPLCILLMILGNGTAYALTAACDECGECHEGPSQVDKSILCLRCPDCVRPTGRYDPCKMETKGDTVNLCEYCYQCYEGSDFEQSRKFVQVMNKLDWIVDNLNVTCKECRTIDTESARVQMDISRNERHMENAYRKKEFRKVTELREQVTELRRTLLKLKGKAGVCRCACRPDVVKALTCKKLVREIAELEKDERASQGDREKLDEKYTELALCNRDLEKLRKIYMKCRHRQPSGATSQEDTK